MEPLTLFALLAGAVGTTSWACNQDKEKAVQRALAEQADRQYREEKAKKDAEAEAIFRRRNSTRGDTTHNAARLVGRHDDFRVRRPPEKGHEMSIDFKLLPQRGQPEHRLRHGLVARYGSTRLDR